MTDDPVPLREYVDQRIADIQARLDERWAGHIHYAEGQFATVFERLRALDDRVDRLLARIDENEGRSIGLRTGWGYFVAVIALASSIAIIVDTLTRR